MALATYSDLKTSVASWLNRTDLTTAIVDFIALAESDIRNDVRVQAMETLATGTLTGETLAHPDYYIEARRLTVGGYIHDYVVPEEYSELSRIGSERYVYTSIGSSLYILGGASGDAYTLIYYAGFTPFSGASDTNWLLTNAPDVYLYGACKHGANYLMDDAGLQRFGVMYKGAVDRVNRREQNARYSGARLLVKPQAVA